MPSYRFCRPDDIPYLVRAVNECYDIHFPAAAAMTVEGFRTEMKELDVWPSNCVVASSDAGPIAVLIGTKRAAEVMVQRIGVHPDHLRQGHGRHILTSLGQKLSVLGPDRLVAEVPLELGGAVAFFAAAGYRRETSFVDYRRRPAPLGPVPEDWLIPTSVKELAEHGMFDHLADAAWERAPETLHNCQDSLEGVAIASPERFEAFALYRLRGSAAVEIAAVGGRSSKHRNQFLGVLLRHLANVTEAPLSLARMSAAEAPAEVLLESGFEPGTAYARFAATAAPA